MTIMKGETMSPAEFRDYTVKGIKSVADRVIYNKTCCHFDLVLLVSEFAFLTILHIER